MNASASTNADGVVTVEVGLETSLGIEYYAKRTTHVGNIYTNLKGEDVRK